jgi:hypothetical protein
MPAPVELARPGFFFARMIPLLLATDPAASRLQAEFWGLRLIPAAPP